MHANREATASKSDAGIADLGEGAGKKKRGSRNKKKNMRKLDISDVDAAQESARHDERTGLVCTFSPRLPVGALVLLSCSVRFALFFFLLSFSNPLFF